MVPSIALPLGISFFTFQQVSFVVDSYYKRMPRYGFIEYALFVSFFPQLVAGPIVLHSEMLPQFGDEAKKKLKFENLAAGLRYFSMGLAKKVLVADSLGKIVDAGFQDIWALDRWGAVSVMLAYTLQIYFDFSGYCDMAMGLGRFFNIDLPVNFDSPYKAGNGILEEMAYDADQIFHYLSLYSAWRQQEGKVKDVSEYYDCFYGERIMAWS